MEYINNKEKEEAARNLMVRYGLEEEKPTRLFRKMKCKAHFEMLLVKEKDVNGDEYERTVTDQKSIEWEVRKFYWNLYKKQK